MVMATDEFPVPFTIGFFRPTVVLNSSLLESFKGRRLEAILAHEIAHIKRFDSLTRWLAIVLKRLSVLKSRRRFGPIAHLEVERELVATFSPSSPSASLLNISRMCLPITLNSIGGKAPIYPEKRCPSLRFNRISACRKTHGSIFSHSTRESMPCDRPIILFQILACRRSLGLLCISMDRLGAIRFCI